MQRFCYLLQLKCVFLSAVLLVIPVSYLSLSYYANYHHYQGTLDSKHFAVFGCATPSKMSHRGFDYAFYLPLTVTAWNRIGFQSIVLIIGRENEWKDHPALSYVLDSLKDLKASIIFMDADVKHRMMISQTARIFAANLKDYPGRDADYIITSDADLWPLRRDYYLPRENHSLLLLHSDCCGDFNHSNRSYRMIPMGYIGANAAIWRKIFGSTSIIKDSEDILKYFSNFFGEKVYRGADFGTGEWYYDQKLISILVEEWMKKEFNQNVTYEVSYDLNGRIDRSSWNPEEIKESQFERYFDAHLPLDGFLPENWSKILPLIQLMYGSNHTSWFDVYVKKFYQNFRLFIE